RIAGQSSYRRQAGSGAAGELSALLRAVLCGQAGLDAMGIGVRRVLAGHPLGAASPEHHREVVNADRTPHVEINMKTLVSLIAALQLAAFTVRAQEQMPMHDHLAMLKAYLAAHSSHGPVIPQPDTVQPTAVKT